MFTIVVDIYYAMPYLNRILNGNQIKKRFSQQLNPTTVHITIFALYI